MKTKNPQPKPSPELRIVLSQHEMPRKLLFVRDDQIGRAIILVAHFAACWHRVAFEGHGLGIEDVAFKIGLKHLTVNEPAGDVEEQIRSQRVHRGLHGHHQVLESMFRTRLGFNHAHQPQGVNRTAPIGKPAVIAQFPEMLLNFRIRQIPNLATLEFV